ncbi:MAG: glycosyltransferase family 4 protein [Actinomycetota bacterium]
MRVALACPYAWDAAGGVQVHVGDLARRLRDRGDEVLVLAPSREPPAEPWVRSVGRPVRIPYAGTVAPICSSPGSWSRVRTWLEAFAPDVVHVHEPFVPSTSMFATLAARAPVVATFHAYLDRSRLQRLAGPLLGRVARRVDAGIAVSAAASEFLARTSDLRIQIVPNGVEVGRFRGERAVGGVPTIAWVGRLDPQKGLGVALDALEMLVRAFPSVRLVVAGDGEDRDLVEELPEELARHVELLGTVPNARVPEVLLGADVFVAPATGQESFGIVLVEAMAAGVPVVASDIPGYREVLRHDLDGLLVAPDDPEALARAVARVLADRDLATRLASAGPERAATFSWEAVLPRIVGIYERAIAGRA